MTYIYVPDDDSEYGPVWDEAEAVDNFSTEELTYAVPATPVVMRDGARGHYLSATFLDDASDILDATPARVARDRISPDVLTASRTWRRVAQSYNEHGGYDCPGADRNDESGLCSDCAFIHDDVQSAESALSGLGYVTLWNDGYSIFRVTNV